MPYGRSFWMDHLPALRRENRRQSRLLRRIAKHQARSGEAATSAPKAGGAPPAGRAKRGRTSGASSRQSAFSPSRPGDA